MRLPISQTQLNRNVVHLLSQNVVYKTELESVRQTFIPSLGRKNLVLQNQFYMIQKEKCLQNANVLPILQCSTPNSPSQNYQNKNSELRKPSEEQLSKVYHALREDLPALFVKSLNYTLYSEDIIFENRITGSCTQGLPAYMRQVSLFRLLGHLKFAYVRLEILKITQHAEDSTVRVRWRILGIPPLRSLPMIFTLKAYTMENAKEKMDEWYDGFSIFHVGEKGLVTKHVVDKMIPDEEIGVVKKASIVTRLAMLIGLVPKPTHAPTGAAVTSSIKEKSSEALKTFETYRYCLKV